MGETPPELSGTRLTDRELLIHAVQHLEDLSERLADVQGRVIRLDHELAVFAPLLARFRPGGGATMVDAMQAWRAGRKAGRHGGA